MLKKVFGRKLNRSRRGRRALFRGLVGSLVEYGKIKTTLAKAKAVQPLVEKLVTSSAKNTLSQRRRVLAKLGNDRKVTQKLFDEVVVLAKNRNSGFTRIVKLPKRKGDSAQMARLEWVEEIKKEMKKKPAQKKAKVKKEVKTKTKKK